MWTAFTATFFTGSATFIDAEDVTSVAFLPCALAPPDIPESSVHFPPWLYRIAHNLVANWHRDRKREPVIALDEFVAGA